MITEKQYLEAKKIVDIYNQQLEQEFIINNKQKELEQNKQEDECSKYGGHYFLESGGKWSPQGQMSCQFYGKTIGN